MKVLLLLSLVVLAFASQPVLQPKSTADKEISELSELLMQAKSNLHKIEQENGPAPSKATKPAKPAKPSKPAEQNVQRIDEQQQAKAAEQQANSPAQQQQASKAPAQQQQAPKPPAQQQQASKPAAQQQQAPKPPAQQQQASKPPAQQQQASKPVTQSSEGDEQMQAQEEAARENKNLEGQQQQQRQGQEQGQEQQPQPQEISSPGKEGQQQDQEQGQQEQQQGESSSPGQETQEQKEEKEKKMDEVPIVQQDVVKNVHTTLVVGGKKQHETEVEVADGANAPEYMKHPEVSGDATASGEVKTIVQATGKDCPCAGVGHDGATVLVNRYIPVERKCDCLRSNTIPEHAHHPEYMQADPKKHLVSPEPAIDPVYDEPKKSDPGPRGKLTVAPKVVARSDGEVKPIIQPKLTPSL